MFSVISCVLLLYLVLPTAEPEAEFVVSTHEEFLKAIGSDRTIVIDSGKIVLAELSSWSGGTDDKIPTHPNPHVSYSSEFDGVSVVISGVENLRILGVGELTSTLLTEPRYAFVLEFRDCHGIQIENLVAGHTTGGYCENGVFGFSGCSDVLLEGCELFGCGTVGLQLNNTEGFYFRNSLIRDCTYGIMEFNNSMDLVFDNSVFSENGEYFGIAVWQSYDILFRNCLFENRTQSEFLRLFPENYKSDITFQDCTVSNYEYHDSEGITRIETGYESGIQ